jgi:hypothetical protein
MRFGITPLTARLLAGLLVVLTVCAAAPTKHDEAVALAKRRLRGRSAGRVSARLLPGAAAAASLPP